MKNAVEKRWFFLRGQKILVAVSGGVDSMVLLHILFVLAKANRWSLSVAHFNHRLRGRASDADEAFVRRAATKLRLPFFSECGDVAGFAAQSKLSVEMAARKLRHEFLVRVARREKLSAIALAHHSDDQVELFFLRLLRGAGGEGLAGMKWRSSSPMDKKTVLIRPLLGLTKAELLTLARENKIGFRHDASNDSTDFLRNRIRNELLPLLRKNYQPAVDKTVLRLMEIVGAEAEFAGDAARNRLSPGSVDGIPFDKLPLAVQRKALQQQLNEAGVAADFDLVEQLRQTAGKFVSVDSDFSVARDAAGKISLRKHFDNGFKADELKMKLSGRAGRVEFGALEIHWAVKKYNSSRGRSEPDWPPPHQPGTEFFDADKIGAKIILRHWQPGDRFQPIGLKSAVKLQDLFVNAKIPAARRRELVLATTGAGEIFWVESLRLGEKFKLTSRTRRQFVWKQSKMAA
ncbi:MAG: tRNA lysidine(34) synthetase TilS [Verrucomicrobiota bacterium]